MPAWQHARVDHHDDESLRRAQRELTSDPTALPDYLHELARMDRLLVEPGSHAFVLVQVRLTIDGDDLRRHPWPTRRGRRPDEGSWWTPGRGRERTPGGRERRRGDPRRAYLLPSTDLGFAWWSEDFAMSFDHPEELIEWLAPRVVGRKEPPVTP